MDKSTEKRFWEKVSVTDGCWLWIASTQKKRNGYGQFIERAGRHETGGERLAHRFSWKLHRGEIPAGMHVLHSCDNPLCVRPDHLFLGKDLDNVRDMIKKGRRVRMQRMKLDCSKAGEIRSLIAHGMSQRKIAKLFSVSPGAIAAVATRRTWVNHASD